MRLLYLESSRIVPLNRKTLNVSSLHSLVRLDSVDLMASLCEFTVGISAQLEVFDTLLLLSFSHEELNEV